MTFNFNFGSEKFIANFSEKARIGLVTNDSGRDKNGRHILDRLIDETKLIITKIFTPEHGFGADAPDGEPVENSVHPKYNIPIISLFGSKTSPSSSDLEDVDILVYDIQDVGVRFYTYISTLRNILETGFVNKKPVHILDRPDIQGGYYVEGPMLQSAFSSFVGHLPVPIKYGMTPGELAIWWKEQKKLTGELVIWECQNWQRGISLAELEVSWRPLSPSMVSLETAKFYPGTCLFEGTNVSEGRGTLAPFQILGAPWVDSQKWLATLSEKLPQEIRVEEIEFVPTFSKYANERCRGIKLSTDKKFISKAVEIGLLALSTLMESHPGQVKFIKRRGDDRFFFDLLVGHDGIRLGLMAGCSIIELLEAEKTRVGQFCELRKTALLY